MKELLDVKEAASFLSVKESWMRNAIAQKRIDIIKLGGLIRISRTHLEQVLQKCTQQGDAELISKSKR